MFNKLLILLTNFHKPFVEALTTWYFLIDQDTDLVFTIFLWDELSFFGPSDPDAPNFFEWYSTLAIPVLNLDLSDKSTTCDTIIIDDDTDWDTILNEDILNKMALEDTDVIP